MIDKYRDIKMSTIKGFAEGYLGHKLSNSEFEDMFRRWDSINHTGPYFTSLGDFLRDYKMEEIRNTNSLEKQRGK